MFNGSFLLAFIGLMVGFRGLRGLCGKIVMSRNCLFGLVLLIFCCFRFLYDFQIFLLLFRLRHLLVDMNEAILDFLRSFLFLKIRFGVGLLALFDKNLQHVLILYSSYLSFNKNSTNTHLILEQEHE